MIAQCPHCAIRLDLPDSIKGASKGYARYRITDSGQLERIAYRETKRGSYKCTNCGYRLSKFIKEVRVGVIGGKKDATPTSTKV